jgi:hypothetical protein
LRRGDEERVSVRRRRERRDDDEKRENECKRARDGAETHMKQTCLAADSAFGIDEGAGFEGRRFLSEFRFEGVTGVFRARAGGEV